MKKSIYSVAKAFFEALMREYEIDADKIGYW